MMLISKIFKQALWCRV